MQNNLIFDNIDQNEEENCLELIINYRTDHGGGIATFMRAEIPARRHFDIECKTLENIVYEVTLDKTKWLIYAIYRPPSMSLR
jgi:hypothetical protein